MGAHARVRATALLFLVMGTLMTAAPAEATYPGDNGKLSFTRYDNGVGREIWVMNPDGTGSTRLLPRGDQPSWSPDGSKLAFSCNNFPEPESVCTAPADGSSVQVVPNPGTALPPGELKPSPQEDPTWSPDGQHLGISSIGACGDLCFYFRIWRIDAVDGSDPILMLEEAVHPSWSQNGRIAVRSYSSAPYEVHAVNAIAPGSSTRLTQGDNGDSPDWSPDGERIVFTSERDGNTELYVMNADGSGQTRITNTSLAEGEPTWSPDGTRIAFMRNYDLYLINPDGTGEVRLTATPDVQEFEPAWQPLSRLGYPRPRAASPVRVPLVPAFEACVVSSNRIHGPPLDDPSCAPPQQRAGYMTLGTQSIGRVRIAVQAGSPATGNQADVRIQARITDVRRASDLADGPGSLELQAPLRLTDRRNGIFNSDSATMQDFRVEALMPCSATADPVVGSTCSLTTTANAVIPQAYPRPSPDFVSEGSRAVWQLGQVEVWDGGQDGSVESTGDNTVLAVQGIFVP